MPPDSEKCHCVEIARMKKLISMNVEPELAWYLAQILITSEKIEYKLR